MRTGPDGQHVEVAYDLLVGADGRNSAVRKALAQHDPSFQYHVIRSPLDYVTFAGLTPPGDMRATAVYMAYTAGRLRRCVPCLVGLACAAAAGSAHVAGCILPLHLSHGAG